MSQNHIKSLVQSHMRMYRPSGPVRVFSCPGRINLIGEHVDYNGGHVLPAAIDKAIFLCISANSDRVLRFNDLQFNGMQVFTLEEAARDDVHVEKLWVYPFGAVKLLEGGPDTGLDFSYFSTIPTGAGVSSSAAITVVTLYAMASLSGLEMDGVKLALLGQRVEREFAGVSVGIMDQFAVIHGRKNSALLLDTRDLGFEYVEVDSSMLHFILVNSGKKHSLRESGYNDRRRDCELALKTLQGRGAGISHLCDLSMTEFNDYSDSLTGPLFKRALHAVSENERTLEFHKCLKRKDYHEAGLLLYGSHESLRDHYEVSIPELDRMVEWAREIEGVYGARMMGGGFGGCTINMVGKRFVARFVERMASLFEDAFGRQAEIYDCTIEDGVREVTLR